MERDPPSIIELSPKTEFSKNKFMVFISLSSVYIFIGDISQVWNQREVFHSKQMQMFPPVLSVTINHKH
jgi:hypothetical protein